MPSGIAIAIDTIRPSSVSSADAGSRFLISVTTGWPVVSDLPRSPLREIADVAAELHDQRLVEAELHADLLDRLLVAAGPAK